MNGLDKIKAGRKSDFSTDYSLFETISWPEMRRAMSLIEELAIVDPEANDAVGNVIRLGNSGVSWLIVSPSARIAKKAHEELDRWANLLFKHRGEGGLHSLVNYFLRQAIITGAGSAEAKIARDRSGVTDIYPVDVRSLDFDYNEPQDRYIISQRQKGENIELPLITYQYIPMATPLSGNPYPLPPLFSAINETQRLAELLNAIKDGALKQRLLGLLTLAIKRMTKPQNQSEEEWRREQRAILTNVADEFTSAMEQGLLVYFDEVTPDFLSFTGEASKAVALSEPYERRTARSLNFAWIREQGTIASAYMSIILEKILAEIQSVQRIPSQILSRFAQQHLYMRGIPVISVYTSLDEDAIRFWDKILVQVQVYEKLYAMNVIDAEMIAAELGYTTPDEPPKKATPKKETPPENNDDTSEDNEEQEDEEGKTSVENHLHQIGKYFARYSQIYGCPIHVMGLKADNSNKIKLVGETTFPFTHIR